jgi:hypothetical protein
MIGKTVFLWFQIYGTSADNYFTFVLPNNVKSFVSYPSVFSPTYSVHVTDNGSLQTDLGYVAIYARDNSADVYKNGTNTPWTTSGIKGAFGFICYEAA